MAELSKTFILDHFGIETGMPVKCVERAASHVSVGRIASDDGWGVTYTDTSAQPLIGHNMHITIRAEKAFL